MLRGPFAALVAGPSGEVSRVSDEGTRHFADPASALATLRTRPERWVWWSARSLGPFVLDLDPARCWDLAAVHRLVVGGHRDDPWAVWGARYDTTAPEPTSDSGSDLFSFETDGHALTPGEPLPARAWHADALADPTHREHLGRAALDIARWQADQLWDRVGPRAAAASESGAAVLALRLEHDGLPIHRPTLERIIEAADGPRPVDDAAAVANRRRRDELVWAHLPDRREIDLRNPAAVREALRQAGITVDDTRAWHLEPYRAMSPLVDALLTWRARERIATTYGWHWADRFIGPDDRLRGRWDASDGGAGRMTASSGLHSLPTPMRPAVLAQEGHAFVRADLGQIEPRVLAVVARDAALAQATTADDLYSGVADALQVDRARAKVTMLGAMYGQTTGTAADLLPQMDRTYPTAMAYLKRAQVAGEAGEPVTTFGGRLVPAHRSPDEQLGAIRARGRFTRNAVVQGAAAEFFKAWALVVRSRIAPLGGQVVLCLHDELLVHVPERHAQAAQAAVDDALVDAARWWSGGVPVRFVSDTRVMRSWAEAKD